MSGEDAAPCRHAGTPPKEVVERVSSLVLELGAEDSLLRSHGLTAEEFNAALPMAIEAIRGSASASNADRRGFLQGLFHEMRERQLISDVQKPVYGKDTVYRLSVPSFGDIAVIQKGCPDGAHSSVRWSVPDWASETYLWWLCSSMKTHPGEHISKGVNRLRQRFFSNQSETIDGIIFHNQLCGTLSRPCPKLEYSAQIGDVDSPAPCVYVMPDGCPDAEGWNWGGTQRRFFPGLLLRLFGIQEDLASAYIGHVGFQRRGESIKTVITSRFGPGRTATHRS